MTFSNVPTTVSEQDAYFKNLTDEIRSILNLSSDWNIQVSIFGDSLMGRRFRLTSNLDVRIVITSLSAGPDDILTLQHRLNSPAFLEQLQARRFDASSNARLTSTKSSMSSTSGE